MARAASTKSWLWHQRLSHLNFDTINDLAKNDLVTGVPKFKYHKEHLCPSYRSVQDSILLITTQKPTEGELDLLFESMYDDYIGGQLSATPRTALAAQAPQICSRLDLTYAPSTITTQKPTEGELDLLFESMYDDYIYGQPLATPRTALAAQAPQVRLTPMTSTTISDTASTPTNSSSQATNIPNTSQDIDGLETQEQHAQQQENQAPLQPKIVFNNSLNAMFDDNTFVNPFATITTQNFHQ
nr:retrovirus-related Pol polyprotein from transposon TNT 1-94 [Tanacetum cinerariifolium]